MAKYRVYLEAVASISVEVEAEDEDDAIEKAFDETPSQGWDWPDMGDWYFPADERDELKRDDYVTRVTNHNEQEQR